MDVVTLTRVQRGPGRAVLGLGPLRRHRAPLQALLGHQEEGLGPDHPEVATSLENYAALLREAGRTVDADKMEARAEAIRARHAEQNPAN